MKTTLLIMAAGIGSRFVPVILGSGSTGLVSPLKVIDRRIPVELIDSMEIEDKEHFIIHFRFADELEALAAFFEGYLEDGETAKTEDED